MKSRIGKMKSMRIKAREKYQQEYHKSSTQIQRRKISKQIRAHLMGTDEKHNERHKTEKMKPTEKSKNTIKKGNNIKLKCCPNCGIPGHTKSECAEPLLKKAKVKSIITVDDIHCMFK